MKRYFDNAFVKLLFVLGDFVVQLSDLLLNMLGEKKLPGDSAITFRSSVIDRKVDLERDAELKDLKIKINTLHGIIFAMMCTANAAAVKVSLPAFYRAGGATINWCKDGEDWMNVEVVPNYAPVVEDVEKWLAKGEVNGN
jgi:hypothetical protein